MTSTREQERRAVADQRIEEALAALKTSVDKSMACALDLASVELDGDLRTPWTGAIVDSLSRVKFELRWFEGERQRGKEDARQRAAEAR